MSFQICYVLFTFSILYVNNSCLLKKHIIYNCTLDTFRHRENSDKCIQLCYYLKQNQRCKVVREICWDVSIWYVFSSPLNEHWDFWLNITSRASLENWIFIFRLMNVTWIWFFFKNSIIFGASDQVRTWDFLVAKPACILCTMEDGLVMRNK